MRSIGEPAALPPRGFALWQLGFRCAPRAATPPGRSGPDGWEVACFALVQLAALVRVAGGLAWTAGYIATIIASAACWSAAFAIYAVRYWPVLTGARLDGKPG